MERKYIIIITISVLFIVAFILGIGLGIGLDQGPLKIVGSLDIKKPFVEPYIEHSTTPSTEPPNFVNNKKELCIPAPLTEFNSEIVKYIKDMFSSEVTISPIDYGGGRIGCVVLEIPYNIVITDKQFLQITEIINTELKSKKYILISFIDMSSDENFYKIQLYIGNSDVSNMERITINEFTFSNLRSTAEVIYSGYSKPLDKYIINCKHIKI